jgi:hypothetical protein
LHRAQQGYTDPELRFFSWKAARLVSSGQITSSALSFPCHGCVRAPWLPRLTGGGIDGAWGGCATTSATVGHVGQMGHVFLLMGIKKFLLKTNK